jgi:branched-subunit amino acid ABC-type transport system permease component
MVALTLIFSDLLFGVMLGCVFAVVAHGLNLIWGVVKVVNVAHGEFIMLGAYGAYFLNLFAGLNPLISAIIAGALGIFVGYAFYFGFLHRELRGKETITLRSEMVTLVSTFGLSLFMSNVAVLAFTGNFVGINWTPGTVAIGFLEIPLGALYVTLLAVLIIAASFFFLDRTYVGNAIKAYSQDITATELAGVNPTKVASLATAIGFSVTMAGGALLTVWIPTGINPYMGALYAPISFVIVVLGGPGKMLGSLVGGITLGVVIDVLQAFVPVSLAYAAAFLVLIPVLLFRPEGTLK